MTIGLGEAEIDEQWAYVGNKSEQRWCGYAIDYATGTILAYAFGKRKDEVFTQLKGLLNCSTLAAITLMTEEPTNV